MKIKENILIKKYNKFIENLDKLLLIFEQEAL